MDILAFLAVCDPGLDCAKREAVRLMGLCTTLTMVPFATTSVIRDDEYREWNSTEIRVLAYRSRNEEGQQCCLLQRPWDEMERMTVEE